MADQHIDAGEGGATDGHIELGDADFRRLVEGMGEGLVVADANGTIVHWNAAATRIFGWTAAEALGRDLELIIPERHRGAHRDGFDRVMATGETRYGDDLLQVPALHRTGDRLSISFSVFLLRDGEAGPVRAIAAVIRDETERWNAESEMRRKLAALEDAAAPMLTDVD